MTQWSGIGISEDFWLYWYQGEKRGVESQSVELDPFIYVDTPEAWEKCLSVLREQSRFAIDLEANSLYVYREQVCLIQISTEDLDFIVDPLVGLALDGLGELLADPRVEKIFHASEYDLILLKRDYDWDVCNLFDTMWAARILGYTSMGLAWFLNEHFGITVSKKHQKANWTKRPLTCAQLAYAQMDTHFLIPLRETLGEELRLQGKLEEAQEIFVRESRVRVPERIFDPEGFWSLRGARELSKQELAVLRELCIMRDEEAARRNQPPFKVLSSEMLCRLAKAAPTTMTELRDVKGVPPRAIDRMGSRLLQAIDIGRKAPLPQPPRRGPRTEAAILDRFERLQQWRKLHAQERGVESDVVLTRDSMWEIARENPQTLEALSEVARLGPCLLELYGEHVLNLLQESIPMAADGEVLRKA